MDWKNGLMEFFLWSEGDELIANDKEFWNQSLYGPSIEMLRWFWFLPA